MTRPPIEPGQVWFVDFGPVRGHEQGQDRPALVVSSRFHLDLTDSQLVSVLPLTTVERTGWSHRVRVGSSDSGVITEQVRTVSAGRFRRHAAEITLSGDEWSEVRRVLGAMLVAAS
ncbi:MAG: type II toxin-antitoxin system PemK/MazF family toxin [Acidimicrobiales bacterium]